MTYCDSELVAEEMSVEFGAAEDEGPAVHVFRFAVDVLHSTNELLVVVQMVRSFKYVRSIVHSSIRQFINSTINLFPNQFLN